MAKQQYTNILVEGPDCSGKSTVVERLKNLLKWDSKSLHHRQGNQFQRYLQEYTQENIVFDRGHVSESVYGQLWRGGDPFNEEEKRLLDGLCKHRSLIIFTCPPIHLLKVRYIDRKFSQQIKFEELEYARELFCTIFKDIPHILYTSQSLKELDNLLKKVKKVIG